MYDRRSKVDMKKVDTKEFELPETMFVSDIDNKVLQGIVLQTLSSIEGISLGEGNFIDTLLGRGQIQNVAGIQAEQDNQSRSIHIKIDINICFGVRIPDKAEEIQTKVSEDLTRLTGLHVSSVHLVFRNVIPSQPDQRLIGPIPTSLQALIDQSAGASEDEYNDEF
jgi:uncharacterized alkaline shock family protein YloU